MNKDRVKLANMVTCVVALIAMASSALSIYTKFTIAGLTEISAGLMVCGLTYLLYLKYREKSVTKHYFLGMLTVYAFVICTCFLVGGVRIYQALQ